MRQTAIWAAVLTAFAALALPTSTGAHPATTQGENPYAEELAFIMRVTEFGDPGSFQIELRETLDDIPGIVLEPNEHPLGVYAYVTRTIYLRADIDIERNPCARAVLVHELTHHVQMHDLAHYSEAVARTQPEYNLAYFAQLFREKMESQARQIQRLWLGTATLPPFGTAEKDAETCATWLRSETPAWRRITP
ncbi:MAG: hypothetical protein HY457_00660 [Parcubacteria group bacterium]|nr:hypothetical protein [Parcubacteria group bacterium]